MFHPFRLVRRVLMGENARAALGSPMASVVFTRGHFGTTHAADRLRARESTAECMQGRTRVARASLHAFCSSYAAGVLPSYAAGKKRIFTAGPPL